MQQLPILYLTTTKLIVTKSIFSNKAKFLKINLIYKYDDFLQKLVSENIVRETSDDYCLDV